MRIYRIREEKFDGFSKFYPQYSYKSNLSINPDELKDEQKFEDFKKWVKPEREEKPIFITEVFFYIEEAQIRIEMDRSELITPKDIIYHDM